MAYYRIEIKLNTGKEFRVVRFEREKSLDEYFLDVQAKAKKEYGDAITYFDVAQLSRYSADIPRSKLNKPGQQTFDPIIIRSAGKKSFILNDPT